MAYTGKQKTETINIRIVANKMKVCLKIGYKI